MDKLAENLQKLQEDDLLQVVQLIHDNKTQESYTKNDVESREHRPRILGKKANVPVDGEFHVDLYTLPDKLVEMLWNFSEERVR